MSYKALVPNSFLLLLVRHLLLLAWHLLLLVRHLISNFSCFQGCAGLTIFDHFLQVSKWLDHWSCKKSGDRPEDILSLKSKA